MTHVFQWKEQRIDSYLAKEYDHSRSFFHKCISRGAVRVQGKKVKKSYILQPGDVIQIEDLESYIWYSAREQSPKVSVEDIDIYTDYAVIYKPKWVVSHPNSIRDVQTPSIAGFVYQRFGKVPSRGGIERAGIVHRLDKDTDGYMIVVRTQRWLNYFSQLFAGKTHAAQQGKKYDALRKYYCAQCYMTEEWKRLLQKSLPIYIDEVVLPRTPHSVPKRGITQIHSYTSVKDPDMVQIQIQLYTGRTHQIRYHLSQHGLPVCGDELYGSAFFSHADLQKQACALQLSASWISFIDPDGARRSYGIVFA